MEQTFKVDIWWTGRRNSALASRVILKEVQTEFERYLSRAWVIL